MRENLNGCWNYEIDAICSARRVFLFILVYSVFNLPSAPPSSFRCSPICRIRLIFAIIIHVLDTTLSVYISFNIVMICQFKLCASVSFSHWTNNDASCSKCILNGLRTQWQHTATDNKWISMGFSCFQPYSAVKSYHLGHSPWNVLTWKDIVFISALRQSVLCMQHESWRLSSHYHPALPPPVSFLCTIIHWQ